GEAVRGEPLAAGQGRAPVRGDILSRKGADHPRGHVVDGQVRGGRGAAGGELLEDQGGIESRQAEPTVLRRGIEAAEALGACLADRLAREDRLGIPARGMRRELAGREVPRALLVGALVLGQLEIHAPRTRAQRMLIVVFTPLATASSNQRAVTALVCV